MQKSKDAFGFDQNKTAAKKGGKIAGEARKKLEIASGKKVSKSENFLGVEVDKKMQILTQE